MATTTFKDFMFECENYPHSKESFELMQECSELALMEKFIEDQEFYQENASIFTEGVEVSEGYFAEAADDATIQALMEKAEAKGTSIRYRIYKGLMKILGVFTRFFKKIGNKFDDLTTAGQNVLKSLAAVEMDEAKGKSLKSIIEGAKSKAGAGFTPKNKQPYASHVKVKGSVAALQETIDDIRLIDWIAAALSDQTVVADVAFSEAGKNIGALPVDVIKDSAMMVILGNKNNVLAAVKSLTVGWGDAKLHGITIKVNTKSISKAADELSAIQQKLENKIGELKSEADAVINQVKNGVGAAANLVDAIHDDAKIKINAGTKEKVAGTIRKGLDPVNDFVQTHDFTEGFNKAYGMINVTIGASMKVYNGLNNYRSAAISALSTWVSNPNAVTAAKDGKKSDEPKKDDDKKDEGKQTDEKKPDTSAKAADADTAGSSPMATKEEIEARKNRDQAAKA